MAASNTPLPDLIELSGISAHTTYTTAGGGILGYVDNATYSDSENNNSATEITEINETTDADSGTLQIDGITYDIEIYTPASTSDPVTVTFDGGSVAALTGDAGISQVMFFVATPQGGGATRYFMAVDDAESDLFRISSIQTTGIDTNPAGDDVKINLDQDNNVTVCFATGTLIDTPQGACPVEFLRAGDLVMTEDAGPQPLLWCGRRDYGPDQLAREPFRKPVIIPAGTLGATRRLLVSPQHCIVVNPEAPPAEQRFARAAHLAELPGPLRIAHGKTRIRYHHLLLDRHHVLRAQGVLSESFYPGPIGLGALHQADRMALLAHVPTLLDQPAARAFGPTARPVLRRHEVLALPRLRRASRRIVADTTA